MSAATYPSTEPELGYDRLKEVKEFDESKIGVKGLVDRGLSTIPRFFIHPAPTEHDHTKPNVGPWNRPPPSIPVIDMSAPRSTLVKQIHDAASSLGFFQLTNHGVPLRTIKNVLDGIRAFHELPEAEKAPFYSRDVTRSATYSANYDLYQSKAASWRDTLQMRLGPDEVNWDHVHGVCARAVADWDVEVVRLSEEVMELLCEGLGLENVHVLKEMSCLERRIMVAHYYPYCPQPELTAGLTSHTDPGVVTVLVQNEVPGLQVKVGEEWVDLEPVEGAIVINIGDILQIMSNDEYKSVHHRVVANASQEPRVGVAIFSNPSRLENVFGPLPQLVSPEKPARYRQFTLKDYMTRFFSKELDGKTLTEFYSA